MPKREPNDYEYEPGDQVKVWRVLEHPIGVVKWIIPCHGKPPKYEVEYRYRDGRLLSETFEKLDLTLVERKYSWMHCTCGSNSKRHSDWCMQSKGLR